MCLNEVAANLRQPNDWRQYAHSTLFRASSRPRCLALSEALNLKTVSKPQCHLHLWDPRHIFDADWKSFGTSDRRIERLTPITTAVTEHSDSRQDGLSIFFVLLHLITIFFPPGGHWPDLEFLTVARLSTLDLQKSAGFGRYLLCLLSLDKGGCFQYGWFTCQHLDLARPTILSCASNYQMPHMILHVHTYCLDSLKKCFEKQSKQFQYC